MEQRNVTYHVIGMTCEHCEASVREEIGELTGVETVSADHHTGRVEVVGTGFNDADVAAAVSEAGYQVGES